MFTAAAAEGDEERGWCGGQLPTHTEGEEERACSGQKPTNTEGEEEEEELVAAEPAAAGPSTTKRARSGIDVLDSVSMSISIGEMSLSSKLATAAAAQGLPMLNR